MGDKIVKILVNLDKNQEWLANEINVSGQSISNYVHGRYIPNEKTLRKLKSVLESKKISLNKPENLESLSEYESKDDISVEEELVISIKSLLSN